MNEQSIKLSGKFSVPEGLEIDKSYEIKLTGGVTSIAKVSNEDGTFEYTHTIKPEFGEVLKDNGVILKLKKKGSLAQVLRFKIQACGLKYETEMQKILDQYN